ncbi:MAG: DUF3429 domain-containing protein [Sulfitobacter sp.]
MNRPPNSALFLGLAGLLPFIAGALLCLGIFNATMGDVNDGGYPLIIQRDGTLLLVRYGGIILPFMSGVLWGFATKATDSKATAAYTLSVLPALWWFFSPGTNAQSALINLMIGYAGLLLLDYAFQRWKLAPNWWMSLRVPLTGIVLICLAIGVWS